MATADWATAAGRRCALQRARFAALRNGSELGSVSSIMPSDRRGANDSEAPPPPAPKRPVSRPLLTTEYRRSARNVIYEAMMRAGDAFGRPLTVGVSSLTEKVVRSFKQKGFFSFESYDRTGDAPKNRDPEVNKFTRYGAAPFRGDHRSKTEKP